jgi:phage terminase Nu1 subunit (DNA packaging protein)
MAEALGVSEQHFDRYYRPLAPAAAKKLVGRRWWFKSKDVFAIVMANKRGMEAEAEEEDLKAPPDKLAPEDRQLKKARAELYEIELRQRKGELVKMADLRDGLMRLAQILRTCGEILGREYGVEAQRVVEDALKTFLAELKRTCGDRGRGTGQG